MEYSKLSPEVIEAIEHILSRGNTAEIKRRKEDIIVLEIQKKIKGSSPING